MLPPHPLFCRGLRNYEPSIKQSVNGLFQNSPQKGPSVHNLRMRGFIRHWPIEYDTITGAPALSDERLDVRATHFLVTRILEPKWM